jgi:tetratricopeptide (TPR) repeat protein
MIQYFKIIVLLLCSSLALSQGRENISEGNAKFEAGNFGKAEAQYRIAHNKDQANSAAYYNLGNSIYRQGTGSEAKYAYIKAIDVAKTRDEMHRAYHNLGNVHLKQKNYEAAVEAYKNALRNNPYDDETRYNYALARKLKDNNPPPPPHLNVMVMYKNEDCNKSDSDKKSKSPEGKGNEKEMAGDNGQKQQQQNKQGDGPEGKSGSGNRDESPATEAPSQQRIENMLDAINNEEKKIMDRVNSKRSKGSPVKQEKDW